MKDNILKMVVDEATRPELVIRGADPTAAKNWPR